MFVQDGKLRAVGLCNARKVLFIIGIHIQRVRLALLVSQMIPFRSRKRELCVIQLVGWQMALDENPLFEILASYVFDYASADKRLARLVVAGSFAMVSHSRVILEVDLLNAAISGTQVRKVLQSGTGTSSNPSSPGKKLPQN